METGIKLVEHMLSMFARQRGLLAALLSREGEPLVHPTGNEAMIELARDGELFAREWLRNIEMVSVLDVRPGLKAIVAPVYSRGGTQCYIWAGVMMEEGTRPYLLESLKAADGTFPYPASVIDRIPDTPPDAKRRLVADVKVLADALSSLLDYDFQQSVNAQTLDSLLRMLELVEQKQDFSAFVDIFMEQFKEVQFAGFAAPMPDGECVVTHMIGGDEYASLIGSRFSVGEGFLGNVLITGEMAYWDRIETDPRSSFFAAKGIRPKALLCYPVRKNGKPHGVIFCGTCNKPSIEPLAHKLGKMIASMFGLYLARKDMLDSLNEQLQRVNIVMEICQLITRANDVKKIAFMLVDMSLNIVHGKFSAVSLFEEASGADELRVVSRGLTAEQSEQYGKLLLREYVPRKTDLGGTFDAAKPTLRQTEWGATVAEYPLTCMDCFYGVLSVEASPANEEAKMLLSSLATVGAVSIRQLSQSADRSDRGATYLHEAMQAWDVQAYRFAEELTRHASAFASQLGLTEAERASLEAAGSLAGYEPAFIERVLGDLRIRDILEDYYGLRDRNGSSSEHARTPGLAGKLLYLASEYVSHRDPERIAVVPGIEAELRDEYVAYLLQSQALDRQVSLKERTTVKLEALTRREQEVLELAVQGFSNKQIATTLVISEHTVKNHMTNMFNKLGVTDRAGLLAYFYSHQSK